MVRGMPFIVQPPEALRAPRGTMRVSTLCLAGLVGLSGCGEVSDWEDELASTQAALTPAPYFGGDPANRALFAADVSFWETPLAQSQIDCFWESGVRHVVVGTQVDAIAQQQLAMAVARGMTVDAYVYLYWDRDIAAQVRAAFDMVRAFPIGTMWLDVEEASGAVALGKNKLTTMIRAGIDECKTHGVGCGLYTSPGYWKTYLNDSPAFTDVPLWYALYNRKRTLSDWTTERFGSWTLPVAKQFQTAPLCDVGGADWNVMQVATKPTVIVDRSLPPDTRLPPPAPTGLYPSHGSVVQLDYAKLMSATIPRATSYQLALESWNGRAFSAYHTWTSPDAYVKTFPVTKPNIYRFRARAQNAHGWGPWSAYSQFDYGTYRGPRPTP